MIIKKLLFNFIKKNFDILPNDGFREFFSNFFRKLGFERKLGFKKN